MLSFGQFNRLLAKMPAVSRAIQGCSKWDNFLEEKKSYEDKDRGAVTPLRTSKELLALGRNSLGCLSTFFARRAERVVPWPRIASRNLADAANRAYSKCGGKR